MLFEQAAGDNLAQAAAESQPVGNANVAQASYLRAFTGLITVISVDIAHFRFIQCIHECWVMGSHEHDQLVPITSFGQGLYQQFGAARMQALLKPLNNPSQNGTKIEIAGISQKSNTL